MDRSDRIENSQLHIQTTELSETAPRRRNRTPLRFLIVLPLMLTLPALAQVRVPVSDPLIASSPASDPRAALFESGQRRYLLGDWGGKRTSLAEKGVTFDFFYISDMQANPSGGRQQTQAGWERARGTIDINFDRLLTWQGLSFHATGLWQSGANLGAKIGTLANPSDLVSAHTTRLDSFWLQQLFLNKKLRVRACQLAGLDFYGNQEYIAQRCLTDLYHARSCSIRGGNIGRLSK